MTQQIFERLDNIIVVKSFKNLLSHWLQQYNNTKNSLYFRALKMMKATQCWFADVMTIEHLVICKAIILSFLYISCHVAFILKNADTHEAKKPLVLITQQEQTFA